MVDFLILWFYRFLSVLLTSLIFFFESAGRSGFSFKILFNTFVFNLAKLKKPMDQLIRHEFYQAVNLQGR